MPETASGRAGKARDSATGVRPRICGPRQNSCARGGSVGRALRIRPSCGSVQGALRSRPNDCPRPLLPLLLQPPFLLVHPLCTLPE